jgi:CRISPR/Cas system CSM-associated protein Csm2 small subunit
VLSPQVLDAGGSLVSNGTGTSVLNTAGSNSLNGVNGVAQALGAAVAVIGALVSTALAAKSIVSGRKSIDQATLGDNRVKNNFTAISGTLLAGGVVGGLAVGGALAPFTAGISVPAGAAIGAAIGAALAQVTSNAIASVISKETVSAIRKGLPNQRAFAEQVKSGLKGDAFLKSQDLLTTQIPLGIASGGLSKFLIGDALNPSSLFGGAVTPNIEHIVDKLVAQTLNSIGIAADRHAKDFLGELIPAQAATRVRDWFGVGGEFARQAKLFARVIAAISGAGTDSTARLARVYNMLANAIGKQAKSAEEVQKILDNAVVRIGGGSLRATLKAFSGAAGVLLPKGITPTLDAPGKAAAAGKPLSREQLLAVEQFQKGVQSLVVPAFSRKLPGADVQDLVEQLIPGLNVRVKRRDVKQSKETFDNAFPALFETADFNKNFDAFTSKLADGVKSAFTNAIVGSIRSSIVGNVFDELFARLRRATRGRGLSEQKQARLERILEDAGERAGKSIVDLKGFLEKAFKLVNDASDTIEEATKTPEKINRERVSLVHQIQDAIQDFLLTTNDILRQTADHVLKINQKLFSLRNTKVEATDSGVNIEQGGVDPASRGILADEAKRQQKFFSENAGILSPERRIKVLSDLESTVDSWLSTSIQLIKEQFDPLIKLAVQAKQVFTAAQNTIRGLRLGGSSILTARQKQEALALEVEKQKKLFRSTEGKEQLEAGSKLVELIPQLIEATAGVEDQNSAQFRSAFLNAMRDLEEVQQVAGDSQLDLDTIADQIREKVTEANNAAAEYYEYIKEHTTLADTDLLSAAERRQKDLFDALGVSKSTPLVDVIAALMGKSTQDLNEILGTVQDNINGGGRLGTATPVSTDTGGGPTPGSLPDGGGGGGDNTTAPNARRRLIDDANSVVEFLRAVVTNTTDTIPSEPNMGNLLRNPRFAFAMGKWADDLRVLQIPDRLQEFADSLSETMRSLASGAPPGGTKRGQALNILNAMKGMIPAAKAGGLVLRNGLVQVGEDNQPEAILPLQNPRAMQMIAESLARAVNQTTAAKQAAFMAFRASTAATQSRDISQPTSIRNSSDVRVDPGAIVVNLHEADRGATERLPKQLIDLLIREVRYGRLGQAIKER